MEESCGHLEPGEVQYTVIGIEFPCVSICTSQYHANGNLNLRKIKDIYILDVGIKHKVTTHYNPQHPG